MPEHKAGDRNCQCPECAATTQRILQELKVIEAQADELVADVREAITTCLARKLLEGEEVNELAVVMALHKTLCLILRVRARENYNRPVDPNKAQACSERIRTAMARIGDECNVTPHEMAVAGSMALTTLLISASDIGGPRR